MVRITAQDREEMKKRDNISRRRKEEDEEIDRTTWAKYTLGLRHQVNRPGDMDKYTLVSVIR